MVLVTVLSAIVAALSHGVIGPLEWVNIGVIAVGALSVFTSPNVPGAAYTKSVLAVLAAVLTVLTSVVTGGVTQTEWLQIAIAALGALGVYALPNKPELGVIK